MSRRVALLACLLAAAAPAAAGCRRATKEQSQKFHTFSPPQPPFAHVAGVASASASALAPAPGDRPFSPCGPEYHRWPEGATGGPFAQPHCYLPAAGAQCLELTAPALPRVLGTRMGCVFSEDHAHRDPDPKSGQERCCYNLWMMGIGRPLVASGEARLAGLRAGGW